MRRSRLPSPPRRRCARDVPYSLLDVLVASGCRAELNGDSAGGLHFVESQREVKRCMDALRGGPH